MKISKIRLLETPAPHWAILNQKNGHQERSLETSQRKRVKKQQFLNLMKRGILGKNVNLSVHKISITWNRGK